MTFRRLFSLAGAATLALFAFALPAWGQFTNVTAIVRDPNGNIYANCSYSVDFVNRSTLPQLPLLSGSQFQTSFSGARCDSGGNLSIRLGDNNQITPNDVVSQWRFSICDQTSKACFATQITITGASQDITASLQSAAAPLPNATFGNISVTGINGLIYLVPGTSVGTLSTCYAAIASTGGLCMVPPNYTETLTSNITMNKTMAGFVFMGPATITMGTNQILGTAGTKGIIIDSWAPFSQVGGANVGVRFVYTGTGAAISIGNSSTDTTLTLIRDIGVDISGAGTNAVGISILRNPIYLIERCWVNGSGGANGQIGVNLDGTGNSTSGQVNFCDVGGVAAGISMATGANANTILGGSYIPTATGTGIQIAAGNGNTITGVDISSGANGVALSSNALVFGNNIQVYSQANTTDFLIGALAVGNRLENLGANAPPIVTDNSPVGANTIVSNFRPRLLNSQNNLAPLTGNSGDQTFFTYTIPGGTVPPGKAVRVTAIWKHSTGVANVTYKLSFGGVLIINFGSIADTVSSTYSFQVVLFNEGTTTAKASQYFINDSGTGLVQGGYSRNIAANMSSNQAITFTFNVANTDQVTPDMFLVELVQP